jgi:tetratricopeptide (TPR) repeat protein
MRIFETRWLFIGLFCATLTGAGAYFFHNQDEIKNVPGGPETVFFLKNTVANAELVFAKAKTKVMDIIDSVKESQVVSVDTQVKKPSTEPAENADAPDAENPAEDTSTASHVASSEQAPDVEATDKTEDSSSTNQVAPSEQTPVIEVSEKVSEKVTPPEAEKISKKIEAVKKVIISEKNKIVEKVKSIILPKDDFSRVVDLNKRKKFAEAIALLEASKDKIAPNKLKNEYFIAYTGLGNELRKKGDCKSAIGYFKKAFSTNLTDPSSPLSLADCYIAENRSEETALMTREALSLSADKANVYFSLAQSYSNANLPDKAKQSYDKALAIDPENWEYVYGLGHKLFTLGRLDESIRFLNIAEKITTTPGDVYWSLSMAHCKNQSGKLAREYYLKLLKTRHLKINTVANYLGKHCSKTEEEPVAMTTVK